MLTSLSETIEHHVSASVAGGDIWWADWHHGQMRWCNIISGVHYMVERNIARPIVSHSPEQKHARKEQRAKVSKCEWSCAM